MQTCHDGRILNKLQLCADRPIAGPYMNADLTVTYSPLALTALSSYPAGLAGACPYHGSQCSDATIAFFRVFTDAQRKPNMLKFFRAAIAMPASAPRPKRKW
jgi:hypothetical protein